MKVGIVVPHLFMQRDILPHVIFSPASLALELTAGLQKLGVEVTLFSPGPVHTSARNVTADLTYFQQELAGRGDTYIDLLKKHPLTFITLARQVQAEIIAKAFAMANAGDLDLVHIYTNEEDIALPFATLCTRPVVFTHHDPFNFLVKYKNIFPKYARLHWLSMSMAQRKGMPPDTNWLANIYHGLPEQAFTPNYAPAGDYIAYLGRIIEPKGVHLAIAAVRAYNATHNTRLKLRIAGKHYAGTKDSYWKERILPELDAEMIYTGFIASDAEKQTFLGDAQAVLVPSVFEEPFGMVVIEALACGTPVIGLDSGALPEIIQDGASGIIVPKQADETATVQRLAQALEHVPTIKRQMCRAQFEARFTSQQMCQAHLAAYQKLIA
jgi:glycosyltransferase involved in cell wall biosynthesis